MLRVLINLKLFSEARGDYFITVVHHDGQFVYTTNMNFTKRKVDYFGFCHVDAMSMIEINDMIEQLGYTRVMNCYWKDGGGALNHDVVKALKTDFDVVNMIATFFKNHYIHVYLEDKVEDNVDDGFAEQEPEINIVFDTETETRPS